MIRNLAVTMVVLILVVVFQPQLKSSIFEIRHSIALSRIDLEDAKKSELRDAISRLADSYSRGRLTDVERRTVKEKLDELKAYQGKELSVEQADAILRRLETILERYEKPQEG